jgi:hypothetical protein
VLFTRELQRRLDENESVREIVVNCFNPGLIVGTGLFRDQNPVFTKVRFSLLVFVCSTCSVRSAMLLTEDLLENLLAV